MFLQYRVLQLFCSYMKQATLFPMLKCMCAVPSMAVFSSSLMSCLPIRYKSLRYFLNDFEMVPVAPKITGITFVFTFPIHCISTVKVFIF